MNRRNVLLKGFALIGFCLATALPGIANAQNNQLIGIWKLNLERSKFSPGPAPRSQTLSFTADGANLTNTADSIDAQGQATKTVFLHIYDGKPHAATGAAGGLFDSTTYTRTDDRTVNWVRSKDGKSVQTGSNVLSADGKTFTVTTDGAGPDGKPVHNVAVYEKQ